MVSLLPQRAAATANFVYHEQTNNFAATPTCPSNGTETACGRYVENIDRDGAAGFQIYANETYALHFKVEFQFYTNELRVYYTTDGSRPCGSFGTSAGRSCNIANTTQVAVASYTCTYQDAAHGCQVVDLATASIPAQPAGTTIKYIVSAWHSGGGDEIFANSGSCPGCPSYTFSDQTPDVFQYNVIAPPPLPLDSVVSRKTHPGVGDFDVSLFIASELCGPGPCPRRVECRSGGANGDYRIIFHFQNPMVTCGTATSSNGSAGTPTANGNDCAVNLSGIPNEQYDTVALIGAQDNQGNAGNVSTTFGVLLGDTNGDASVNSADIAQTKSQSGQLITNSNFREDLTVEGSINSTDIALVKSRSGTALP